MAEKTEQEVSRKWCVAEQNGRKFWHSGLYIQRTHAKYGQKSQTGSWFRRRGNWVISGKQCVVGKTDGNFDLRDYIYSIHIPNMAKKAKLEVESYLGNGAS